MDSGGKLRKKSAVEHPPLFEKDWVTLAEAAERLSISKSKIYQLVEDGELPVIIIPGRGKRGDMRINVEEASARLLTWRRP